ncbi:hypothetical protein TUM20985_15210 [Mycobacterium antarcticum]|nr:hypothetical protein TUM20985_15210 [Mycolicibacterium sp. TUM20985]GLP74324.1 hypothetical protein TUM20983_14340 [Mycolicibacterium sp. TUM20983]GLP80121.1 hypothetical protein TUM20984_15410 [Mycolicibacterium sp. TUM20984]
MEHFRRDPDVQRERPVEYEDHHLMRSKHHPTPIRSTRADRVIILARVGIPAMRAHLASRRSPSIAAGG